MHVNCKVFRTFLWIIVNTQGKGGQRLSVTSLDDHIWASSQPNASDLPLSHLLVRGIEYLSTVAVGRRKSTKPAPFILVPLYLDSLHPVNCEVLSDKFFYPFQKAGCLNQGNHISTAINTWRGWLTEKRQSQETRRSLFRFHLVFISTAGALVVITV